MNTLSKQNYIKTLKKIEKSPSDRIVTLGIFGSVLGALALEPKSNPLEILLIVSTISTIAYGAIRLTLNDYKHNEHKRVIIKTLKNKIANLNEDSDKNHNNLAYKS